MVTPRPAAGAAGGVGAAGAAGGGRGGDDAGGGGQRPTAGWHLAEWACELVGTGILLLVGLSAICLDFGPHSPVRPLVPSHSGRLLVTGLIFAASGSLVAVSPLGRRSGAHLNPAVTVAFWCRHHVHPHDLAGYVVAQVLGAFAGTTLVAWLWGPTAASLHLGATQPGNGLGGLAAAGVEALMTAVLVGVILAMVSSKRTARWTPLVLWLLIAVLVWQGAPWTGTSLNPARSLAPAVLAPDTAHLWVYLAGPLAGALVAVAGYATVAALAGNRRVETLTAKLFHDPAYPSTLATALPSA